MNFSVVLIARNESKTLPKLVQSLAEFQKQGGEICLLDTGSTDDTAALARGLGCKVEEVGTKFVTVIDKDIADKVNKQFVVDGEAPILKEGDKLFDYSAARNYAATMASNDMIATPDCDEQYTMLNLDVVQSLIASGVEQLEYNFVFSHDEFGNEVIKFMHSKFYNRTKLKWVGIVHEVPEGVARRQFVGEDIIKLEHWQMPSAHRSSYINGLAYDCFFNMDKDRNSHYLARELLGQGRPKSAIKEFERHVAMKRMPPEMGQSCIHMGDAYGMLGDEEKQVASYNRAIYIDGGRREAWIRLAEFYHRKNDPQRCACYATAALEIGRSWYFADFEPHYRNIPHELLYWAEFALGNKEASLKHYEKALEYVPTHPKYLYDYRVDH